MTGWFKTHRKMKTSPIFSDPYLFKLWMLCLMKASHKEHEQLVGNQTVTLQPGQFVTGRIMLTNEYNYGATGKNCMKELTVWRWLKSLEKMQMLNIKSTNKYSVVTIVNWTEHQNDEQQMNNKRTTNEQQMITNKNVKKEKNEKKDHIPYVEIVKYLNEKSGRKFNPSSSGTRKLIEARWNEDNDIEAFKRVIDVCCYKWKGKTFSNGNKGDDYLQPSTLFNTKFDERLNWAMDSKRDASQEEPQYKSNSVDSSKYEHLGMGY